MAGFNYINCKLFLGRDTFAFALTHQRQKFIYMKLFNKEINFLDSKNILYFFISVSLGATAFQVFSAGLKDLHWAYAGFLFSVTSWVSVKLFHSPTVYVLNKVVNLSETNIVPDKKWRELTNNEWKTILFLGIISFGNFAIMLPYLKNQEQAIYFTIIGSSLFRIIAIPIAQKLFNDKIGDKKLYWIGFIICIAGVLLFKWGKIANEYSLLLWSLLWGIISIISDQAKRYITIPLTERKIKFPYLYQSHLSIKTQQEKSELVKTVLFLITAIIYCMANQFSFSLPNAKEIMTALWIGYAVTVFGGTIAVGLKNKIGETVGGILQSSRVVSSMLYLPIIAIIYSENNPCETWSHPLKWIGVGIITIGSLLGLVFGKPSKA